MTDENASTVEAEAQEQDAATPAETGESAAEESKQETMIPKARLDAEIAKRKELQSAAEELERLKKQQADAEAEKAGAIDKFKAERDQYEAEAKQWQAYATSKLDGLTEQLDDAGKAILEDLGDEVPLSKRLAIAEKLAVDKKTDPGFGTSGGKKAPGNGAIPPEVATLQDFHRWWQEMLRTPEGRAKVADREFNRKVNEERLRRFK